MSLRGNHLLIATGLALTLSSCQAASLSLTAESTPDVPDPSRIPPQSRAATATTGRPATERASESPATPIAQPISTVASLGGGAGELAFVSDRDGNDEVYVVDLDRRHQTRLTTNPHYDIDPAWSPNGQAIAFASDRDGEPAIYVMKLDGSSQTRVTSNPASDWAPHWRP